MMHRLVFAAALAVCSATLALAGPTVLHVSPSGNDAWSGKLAAPNAAKTDGPLASLIGAREAIRKLKAAGPLTGPVEVRLRGGVYRPAAMLELGPQDSGSGTCPISYVAYPKETPVLSGGVPVNGFKPWRGKIVCADLPARLPAGTTFRSLFVDGERMIRAWQKLGFDKQSMVGDPQFVNPAKHDYRLKATSPALKLGFEQIGLSTVGPKRR
jgi:hypothetical protein